MTTVEAGLAAPDVALTGAAIASVQESSGQIPWFADGPTDPWDHVEAAMALDVAGRHPQARAAYVWLSRTQNPDGSWYRSYRGSEPVERIRESNFSAYLAVGLLHHVHSTGDTGLVSRLWPTLTRAMRFVLGLRRRDGVIAWAEGATEALLTGCSSIYHSLRCAAALAELCGQRQPAWEDAAAELGHAIAHSPELFSPRDRYSMDWYYPVLCGAVRGPAAVDRLAQGWDTFVVPGLGVRCVNDQPWVTGAETCELVLALACMGDMDRATRLFADMQHLREADGSYWTGYVYPDDARWPEERTTWTAGAVLLASAMLTGDHATTVVFGAGSPSQG
jgi:hypothetical protein